MSTKHRKLEKRTVRAKNSKDAMSYVRKIQTLTNKRLVPVKAKATWKEYEVSYYYETERKK